MIILAYICYRDLIYITMAETDADDEDKIKAAGTYVFLLYT